MVSLEICCCVLVYFFQQAWDLGMDGTGGAGFGLLLPRKGNVFFLVPVVRLDRAFWFNGMESSCYWIGLFGFCSGVSPNGGFNGKELVWSCLSVG